MKQIEALNEKLNKIGFKAKIWQDRRIYINGFERTLKAYITFDNPQSEDYSNLFEGAALCVFSDCESQTTRWNVNRSKQVKHRIMRELKDADLISVDVPENWEDVL